MIVDTGKVLREADGPTKARGPEASNAWWVERCSPPGAPQEPDGESRRSPKNTSENVTMALQRITLEELAITHFVKNGTVQNACTTRPRVVVGLGRKCAFAHRQVDEQPKKRSKTNKDKSAVAMLKKGNWQESVTDGCHDRTGQPVKRSVKKLGQNSSERRFSDARQLGCVFQDMTPPKSYSPEEH